MSWRDRPFMGLDTETTGTDPEAANLVTACVGLAGGTHRWTARNWLLQQADEIPAEATAIHGITTEHANQHGQDPVDALQQIVEDLQRGWAMSMPLVIYNAPYDLTVLDRNLRRQDLPPLNVAGPVIDPFVIDKAIDRYRRGSRKLVDVAAHYGITLDAADAHGAEADALAACRIAWKQAALKVPQPWSGDRPAMLADWPLKQLHAWQADRYAEQRASFAAYLAKQGKQLDDPSTVWPMKPLPIVDPLPSMVQTDLFDPDLEPAPF